MAARKLQTEIDRTLKKVAEGVEQFEDLYKKIQQTNNFTHKEKQEAELKTQIKKLQRLRDQIKTWLASNEIKDKKALTDNRKLIELQMERFKACEKEMKTKAFSKEGLSAGHKLDPKEQLKAETADFVSAQVEELARQVETTEAEIELLQGGAKKSKKGGGSGQDKISQLEDLNDRRAWHISRLELILRLIQNGNLDPDRIVSLKEDIGYFVESNTEEDFEEDEGLYDELNLDEEEEAFGLADKDDIQSSHDSMSVADVSEIIHAPPVRTPAKATPKASASSAVEGDGEKSPTATKVTKRKPTLDGTAQRPTGLNASARSVSGTTTSTTSNTAPSVQSPAAVPAPSGPAPRAVPAQLPPIRYSAAAASAVAAQSPTPATVSHSKEPSIQSVSSPSAASSTTQPLSAAQVASPSTVLSPGAGLPAAPAAAQVTESATAAKAQSPQVAKAQVPQQAASAATASASPSPAPSHASIPQPAAKGVTPSPGLAPRTIDSSSQLSPSQQAASIAPLQALELGSQTQQQSISPGDGQNADSNVGLPMASPAISGLPSPGQLPQGEELAGQQGQSEPRLPSSLADLVTSFENAKQKSIRRDNNLGAVNEILEAGYPNIPQAADAEKPRYYVPRNAYPTPHYYPQQPTPHHANPSMFSKFDIDTLFYIFYYCQGTYMQYLAAQELKKQSWRFHKQYLTWFQRANEPQMITDEFEQGVYLYFDFEGSWAQRRKENFTFFYRHLEE